MPVITPGDRDYLSDPSILKELSKKNFIRENIKHLKQLEKKNKRDKKKSESENEIPSVHTRRPLGRSKSQAKFGRRRLVESKSSKSIVKSAPKSPTTQVELFKASSSKTGRSNRTRKIKAHRIQTQTGGGDASSNSENEVTKKTYIPDQVNKALQTPTNIPAQTVEQSDSTFSPFSADDIKREMKAAQDVDYVKLNQLVQYKPKKNVIRGKTDPTKAPPTYQRGVLPKYLREQRKDIDFTEEKVEPARERDHPSPVYQNIVSSNQTYVPNQINKKTKVSSPACPPGHILISDSERKQQLNEMRKHYAELITKLNKAPFHTDSHKARQMKSDLESELENLEAAISLFSKDKLIVKIT